MGEPLPTFVQLLLAQGKRESPTSSDLCTGVGYLTLLREYDLWRIAFFCFSYDLNEGLHKAVSVAPSFCEETLELNIILGFGEVISVGDNLGEEISDF